MYLYIGTYNIYICIYNIYIYPYVFGMQLDANDGDKLEKVSSLKDNRAQSKRKARRRGKEQTSEAH